MGTLNVIKLLKCNINLISINLTVYWREFKTPAHPRHCRDSSEVKSWHFSPAVSPLLPALGGRGYKTMTGALNRHTHAYAFFLYRSNGFEWLYISRTCFPRMHTITTRNRCRRTYEPSHVIIEPSHGKTNNLHRRKQRRRSASR